MRHEDENGIHWICDQCPISCNTVFKTASALNFHNWNTHSEVELKCEKPGCTKVGFVFKTLQTFRRHQKSCGVDALSLCRFCGRPFKQKRNVGEHEKVCQAGNNPPLVCDFPNCGRVYTTKLGLDRHKQGEHWTQRTAEKLKNAGKTIDAKVPQRNNRIPLDSLMLHEPSSCEDEPQPTIEMDTTPTFDNDLGSSSNDDDDDIVSNTPTSINMDDETLNISNVKATIGANKEYKEEENYDVAAADQSISTDDDISTAGVPTEQTEDSTQTNKKASRVYTSGCPWIPPQPVLKALLEHDVLTCPNQEETLKMFSQQESLDYWTNCREIRQSPLDSVAVTNVYEATIDEMQNFPALLRKLYSLGYHHGGIFHVRTPKDYQNWLHESAKMRSKKIKPDFQTIEMGTNPKAGIIRSMCYCTMKITEFRAAARREWNSMPKDWQGQEEIKFWENFIGIKSFYASDSDESLTPPKKKQEFLNIRVLGAELETLLGETNKTLIGVTTPFGYFGSCGSVFGLHVEDGNCPSINIHTKGKPKSWYSIPTSFHQNLHTLLEDLYADENEEGCYDFVRHKNLFPHADLLRDHGIPVFHAKQMEGDMIITLPLAYHYGWNHGENHNESLNFADKIWVEFAKHATFCTCKENAVRMLLDGPMKKYQNEVYESWKMGKLYGTIPFSNDSKIYPVLTDPQRKEQDDYVREKIITKNEEDNSTKDAVNSTVIEKLCLDAAKIFFCRSKTKKRQIGSNFLSCGSSNKTPGG